MKTKAKFNEDGKLIVGGSDDESDAPLRKKGKSSRKEEPEDVEMNDADLSLEAGINAYVDAIRGRDAPQRGQRGKLKFTNKPHKGGDEMDVDSDDQKAVRKERSSPGRHGLKSPRGGGGGFKTQRKGLGVEKTRGGRVEKGKGADFSKSRGGAKWMKPRN
jgi:ribosomal RNA-processing protein 12